MCYDLLYRDFSDCADVWVSINVVKSSRIFTGEETLELSYFYTGTSTLFTPEGISVLSERRCLHTGWAKKVSHRSLHITSSNTGRFSKFFPDTFSRKFAINILVFDACVDYVGLLFWPTLITLYITQV